jgi:APA family basic amino acid/polyamine antiporter
LLPRAGVIYHALTEAYGPFAGFMQAWIMVLVSGPGAIAGVAILFGELVNNAFGSQSGSAQLAWATAAILFFAAINLRGAEWGGRTQIVLTAVKIIGLLALVGGSILLATPASTETLASNADGQGLLGFVRFVGLGIAIVLFTYDGWIDASHVAGEVRNPNRNFPIAMGVGVVCITLIYLLVNYAYLRVLPLQQMQDGNWASKG